MMKRREIIALLGGAVASWSRPARAQQPMPVIGLLGSASSRDYAPMIAAFIKSLGEAGFVEGQNVKIGTSGPTTNMTACRHWRPIWSVVR